MRSHHYDFSSRETLRLILGPLVPLLCFIVLLKFAGAAGLLPPPFPILDVDRTILLHQATASRQPTAAQVLLIGDSSCLMNVSAPDLQEELGGSIRVQNLGTLSYLDPREYAAFVRNYASGNRGSVQLVVLLMHPQALRLGSRQTYFSDLLRAWESGNDLCPPGGSPLLCAAGISGFQSRVLTRLLPAPLPGAYGVEYGFSWNLWARLTRQNGSIHDPGRFTSAPVNTEYTFSENIEIFSRGFKESCPPTAKLVIGITPLPVSLAPPRYSETFTRNLNQWAQWTGADYSLGGLAGSLPDEAFASSAHLNSKNVASYTKALAEELKKAGVVPLGD